MRNNREIENLEESEIVCELYLSFDLLAQETGIEKERLIKILMDPDQMTVSESHRIEKCLLFSQTEDFEEVAAI